MKRDRTLDAHKKKIILPINHNSHWVGVFFDVDAARYFVYNSLSRGNASTAHAHQVMASALEPGCDWNLQPSYLELRAEQQQTNEFDCGVFLIAASSNWLLGQDLPLQADMDSTRESWIHKLAGNYATWQDSMPALPRIPAAPESSVDDAEVVDPASLTFVSPGASANMPALITVSAASLTSGEPAPVQPNASVSPALTQSEFESEPDFIHNNSVIDDAPAEPDEPDRPDQTDQTDQSLSSGKKTPDPNILPFIVWNLCVLHSSYP